MVPGSSAGGALCVGVPPWRFRGGIQHGAIDDRGSGKKPSEEPEHQPQPATRRFAGTGGRSVGRGCKAREEKPRPDFRTSLHHRQRRRTGRHDLGRAHERHHQSDGSVVFKMEGAEIPAGWSQLATDIVVSKYFRKAGIHGDKAVGETSVRQVVHRIAHTIRNAGEQAGGYFASKKDADTLRSRAGLDARQSVRRIQLAGLVQLRPVPRVRDRRLGRQLGLEREDREVRRDGQCQCAPAVLGLLHPVRRRRPDGHLRPGQERSAPVQVRVGYRLELQPHSAANKRSSRAAARPAA